jgi:hypothetical protein
MRATHTLALSLVRERGPEASPGRGEGTEERYLWSQKNPIHKKNSIHEPAARII